MQKLGKNLLKLLIINIPAVDVDITGAVGGEGAGVFLVVED